MSGTEFTREEVAETVVLASHLVNAHERRSPTSVHATLSENDALFNLHLQLSRMFKRINGARRVVA